MPKRKFRHIWSGPNWWYLLTQCAEDGGDCQILRDSTFSSPLRNRSIIYNFVVVVYLILFSLYWWGREKNARRVACRRPSHPPRFKPSFVE